MIPIPWRLVGYLAGAAALVMVLWWVQSRIRVSYQAEQQRDSAIASLTTFRESVARAARVAAAQRELDQKADAALNARMAALQAENEAIRRALTRLKATVETTDAQGHTRVAIDPDWWLCVSTFVTRDPADSAACEARSGAGSVPDPVGR